MRKAALQAGEEIPTDEQILQKFIRDGKLTAAGELVEKKKKGTIPKPIVPSQPQKHTLTKSSHNGSPGTNDEQPQSLLMSKEITDLMKDALLHGKDIPSNILYLLAVQSFMQNPSPQWFAAIQSFMKDKDKIQTTEAKTTTKPLLYMRPAAFHPKQHQVVEAIKNPKIKLIFVEGCQRSGKSTSVFAGLHELTLESDHPLRIALLAGKGGRNGRDGGSKGILADVLRDPILQEVNGKVLNFASKTTESILWNSGSELVAMELTVASIKGGDKEIVWIDELDVAISEGQDKREAVVSAVNTMLATKDFKLILSSNLDKGIYQILRDEILKINSENVVSISITKEDCPHLNNNHTDDNYTIAKTISDALLGKGFGQMRLQGIMTSDGAVFDFQSIEDAFNGYYPFMAINKHKGIRVAFLDPSGTVHDFGFVIFEYSPTSGEVWEIHARQWKLGDGSGETWTPQRVDEYLYQKCVEFNVKLFGVEANSGGQNIMLRLKQRGIKCVCKTWDGDTKLTSQENYIRIFRHFLDERKIYFCNEQLRSQLTIYEPKKNKEQCKGDVADAAINCLWWLVGGIRYLRTLNPQLPLQQIREEEQFGAI
jgi:hypothetical protein